jgi:hypothetical protein
MSANAIVHGTNCFVSVRAARSYYKIQGIDAADVQTKIDNGEIRIGVPKLRDGQRFKATPDGRYIITERPKDTVPT